MERLDVSFRVAGARCGAWLFRPDASDGRPPVIVRAHGFAALRELRAQAFAERFAGAGMAALVFDYRHFGSSDGEPRQLLDIGRQLEDWRAAVAYARARADVDGTRVGLWGSSFAGGHVLEVAARDAGVRAAVAQVPFSDGLVTVRDLGVRQALRLSLAGVEDELRRLGRRSPRCFGVVGPPGALAAMTTPDAEPGYLAMVPPGAPWENRVCACIALRLPLYRPGRAAARVRCPLLVCVADDDVICPPGPALAAAARAPLGELRRYAGGHFDVYFPPLFERIADDEASFLARHLLHAA